MLKGIKWENVYIILYITITFLKYAILKNELDFVLLFDLISDYLLGWFIWYIIKVIRLELKR